jgi:hypothetical protein
LGDKETEPYKDRIDRVQLYKKHAAARVAKGVERIKTEGGDEGGEDGWGW